VAHAPQAGALWIRSPAYDAAFFVLTPLLVVPLILLDRTNHLVAGSIALTLGFAHYLSTFTFFAWSDTRAYHRERWLAFFAGPVLILITLVVLLRLQVPWIVQVVVFFWNTWHVARQSCGIVSIYRHRAGVFEPEEKGTANAAIVACSAFLALWNVETHREVAPFLRGLWPELPRALFAVAAGAAGISLARLAVGLLRRSRAGRLHLPEALSLITALALFHPYLWERDSEAATGTMLVPHFLQYLGLVWLVQARKLAVSASTLPERALQALGRRPWLLVGVLAMAGGGVVLANAATLRYGGRDVFVAFALGTVLLHFYLDALFWAFRDPQVRRSLGPHLLAARPSEPALSAA
jgi:hypothetical protein